MIIKKIKLHPFAGIQNGELSFQKGINVLLGPNEAGKSTVVKALSMVLFTPVTLTPAAKKKALENLMPGNINGTIKVTLDFEWQANTWQLEKAWGKEHYAKLTGSDEKTTADSDTIENILKEILGLNEASWANILFTRQSAMQQSIEALKGSNEASDLLTNLLSSTVINQAGASPSEIKSNAESSINEYYNNWDSAAAAPKDNRGIDNPHKKLIGKILGCYYALKRKEQEFEKVERLEKELDLIISKQEDIAIRLSNTITFERDYAPVVADCKKRMELDKKIAELKTGMDTFKTDAGNWPERTVRVSMLKTSSGQLSATIKSLNDELKIAQKREGAKMLREKADKFTKAQQTLKEAKDVLSNCVKVEKADLDLVLKLEKEIGQIKTKIEAQKLKVNILPKKDFLAKINSGINAAEEKAFKAGVKVEQDASGRFEMETELFQIQLLSGNEDIPTLTSGLNAKTAQAQAALNKYNAESSLVLQQLYNTAEEKQRAITTADTVLQNQLGNDTAEEITNQLAEIDSLPQVRDSATVMKELTDKQQELTRQRMTMEQDEQAIGEFTRKYQTLAELNTLLVTKMAESLNIQTQLDQLAPIPAEFESVERFLSSYDQCKNAIIQLTGEKGELNTKRMGIESQLPEQSTEELHQERVLLQKQFDRSKEEGAAYKKILAAVDAIMSTHNTKIYQPYQDKVNEYFGALTGNKYTSIKMDEIKPSGLPNGPTELTLEQLSKGTRDTLALALRLGMTDFYLKDSDGFLIMDDPLTDLDKQRQLNASKCLNRFAEEKQVIILTCHEEHAKELCKEPTYVSFQ